MTALASRTRAPLPPALDFLQHLWRLNHALERMSLKMESRLGVTAQQRLLLRSIGASRGITASQLAALLHLDRGTVSVGLARLGKKGLVTRRREAADRRRVALDLTVRGKALARPDPRTIEGAVERLMARLPASQVEAARRVLAALARELELQTERD